MHIKIWTLHFTANYTSIPQSPGINGNIKMVNDIQYIFTYCIWNTWGLTIYFLMHYLTRDNILTVFITCINLKSNSFITKKI